MNENVNNIDVDEIVRELDDFAVNETIVYEVWALGYTEEDTVTACNILLKTFTDPAAAIMFAKTITITDLLREVALANFDMTEVSYFQVEVETTVSCDDDEGSTENIDTVWETKIEI